MFARLLALSGFAFAFALGCSGADVPATPVKPSYALPTEACSDGPESLPRPPADGLPCELLPPGFGG